MILPLHSLEMLEIFLSARLKIRRCPMWKFGCLAWSFTAKDVLFIYVWVANRIKYLLICLLLSFFSEIRFVAVCWSTCQAGCENCEKVKIRFTCFETHLTSDPWGGSSCFCVSKKDYQRQRYRNGSKRLLGICESFIVSLWMILCLQCNNKLLWKTKNNPSINIRVYN